MVKDSKKQMNEVSRDYTVNLNKRLYKTTFKTKAPKAVKQIVEFAKKNMFTDDVRVDTKLNQYLWSKGIRNVPDRVRVRLSRKKNEDEEGSSKFYTLCQHIPVENYKGLQTEVTKLKK